MVSAGILQFEPFVGSSLPSFFSTRQATSVLLQPRLTEFQEVSLDGWIFVDVKSKGRECRYEPSVCPICTVTRYIAAPEHGLEYLFGFWIFSDQAIPRSRVNDKGVVVAGENSTINGYNGKAEWFTAPFS